MTNSPHQAPKSPSFGVRIIIVLRRLKSCIQREVRASGGSLGRILCLSHVAAYLVMVSRVMLWKSRKGAMYHLVFGQLPLIHFGNFESTIGSCIMLSTQVYCCHFLNVHRSDLIAFVVTPYAVFEVIFFVIRCSVPIFVPAVAISIVGAHFIFWIIIPWVVLRWDSQL